ncbi:MAG: hypothetical protein KA313_08420 [Pseudarcicella sp.]|jgi:thiamine pyrophosphokinase|nr:hypothetical protein [Pseudarcicella sp.]MBP6411107.1 hypothetical protein [Pseudarcicella sp.]
MSSHHVVRENQEPALIISSQTDFDTETIGQLLEWSPFTLVIGENIALMQVMGIKVDALMLDAEINADTICQFGVEIIKLENTANNLLEKALDYFIEKGFPAVNIVGHLLSEQTMTSMSSKIGQIKTVLFDADYKLFFLENRYEKWLPAGSELQLIPQGRVFSLSIQNGKETTEKDFLEEKINIITTKDGFFTITYKKGILFVNEKWS